MTDAVHVEHVVDVAVIGGGVVGAFVARELGRWQLEVAVVEACADVACGASGANSGIVHGGFDPEPGTWKAKMNVEGCRAMAALSQELDVPFRQTGSLVVAHTGEERQILELLLEQGRQNGLTDLALLDRPALEALEPGLAPDIQWALFCPGSGIICPYELTFAAMENAVQNGAHLALNSPVAAIQRTAAGHFLLTAGGRQLVARRVVNAAGLAADRIYQMALPLAADREAAQGAAFTLTPRKGEYLLLDKSQGTQVGRVIFRTPGPQGKGVLVAPTVDGNLLLGPTSDPVEDRADRGTTGDGIGRVGEGALQLVPGINLREVITSFAGLRASPGGDFILGESPVAGFYNAAGIESPGLTSAPAIGRYLAGLVAGDLGAGPNPDFVPVRPPRTRFHLLSREEQAAVIARDPAYGNVICRCETITEGEIVDAIHRPCGATTVDGVKRRVRAGMGRCQGGFCAPKVVELLARELGVSPQSIRKSGPESVLLTGPTKSAGEEESR